MIFTIAIILFIFLAFLVHRVTGLQNLHRPLTAYFQQGLGLPSILCWNSGVIKSLNSALDEEIGEKWPTLINAVDEINSSFDIMRSYLSTYSG